MIPTYDPTTNIIILTGHSSDSLNLYTDVLKALKEMQDPQPVQDLWLPLFTLQVELESDYLANLTVPCLPTLTQQLQMQLFSAPQSDGSPNLTPDINSVVVNENFVVAITNSAVSDAFEMPLVVARVNQTMWKQLV